MQSNIARTGFSLRELATDLQTTAAKFRETIETRRACRWSVRDLMNDVRRHSAAMIGTQRRA